MEHAKINVIVLNEWSLGRDVLFSKMKMKYKLLPQWQETRWIYSREEEILPLPRISLWLRRQAMRDYDHDF